MSDSHSTVVQFLVPSVHVPLSLHARPLAFDILSGLVLVSPCAVSPVRLGGELLRIFVAALLQQLFVDLLQQLFPVLLEFAFPLPPAAASNVLWLPPPSSRVQSSVFVSLPQFPVLSPISIGSTPYSLPVRLMFQMLTCPPTSLSVPPRQLYHCCSRSFAAPRDLTTDSSPDERLLNLLQPFCPRTCRFRSILSHGLLRFLC
jgi:hypothetical protein